MGEQLTKKENLCFTKMKTGHKYSYKERSNIKKKIATVAAILFKKIGGFFYPFCIPQQSSKILVGHLYKNNLFLLA